MSSPNSCLHFRYTDRKLKKKKLKLNKNLPTKQNACFPKKIYTVMVMINNFIKITKILKRKISEIILVTIDFRIL